MNECCNSIIGSSLQREQRRLPRECHSESSAWKMTSSWLGRRKNASPGSMLKEGASVHFIQKEGRNEGEGRTGGRQERREGEREGRREEGIREEG